MERIQGPNRNARIEAPSPHHGTAGRRDDGVLTANSADGKAKLYLNADRIGNVADAPSDITLTLAVVEARRARTIPSRSRNSPLRGTYTIGPGDDLPADIGTVTRTEMDAAVVFSIDFLVRLLRAAQAPRTLSAAGAFAKLAM